MRTPDERNARRSPSAKPATHRGPVRRDEYVQRVREALATDYTKLHTSPLCDLPGVVTLAERDYRQRIFPTAAALRILLDQAVESALAEVEGLEDRRAHQLAIYLRLTRQHMPVAEITRQLGLHSRSYVHATIQRQALELVTEAFLRLARHSDD